ncbi:MAG: glycosyltransferase [Marinobacter sp.]|uniref:glycosyltransferase n=2 Tax=Marinobacter sp. TaxID=50741 RepID=UPI00329829C8
MRSALRKYVIRYLRAFKDLDVRLREWPLYELFSFHVYNVLRTFLGMHKLPYRKVVAHHYLKSYRHINVEDNLALFDCFWGRKVGGDPYAIYREMVRKNPELKCIWVCNKGVSVPDDVSENKSVSLVAHDSKEYAEALLRAKYLICNSNFLPFFVKKPGQIFINTWHGTPIKKLGFDIEQSLSHSTNTQRNFNVADFIPVSSDYEKDHIIKAYGGADFKNNVHLLGAPRLDLTISSNRSSLLNKLGIDSQRKIVLYAPTWRGSIVSVSSQIDDQVAAIEAIKENLGDDVYLFVSLHHLTKQRIKNLSVNVDFVPDNIDINEFLSCVDVLISDYSSIVVDFLVLDRPVILYVPDYEEYRSERGLYIDVEDLPCLTCFNIEELVVAIGLDKKPSEFGVYSGLLNKVIPVVQGDSSEKIVSSVFSSTFDDFESPRSKYKVLVYAGSLKENGITSAFKSFVSYLSDRDVDVYVVVDPRYERNIPSFRSNVEIIRDKAEVILANGLGATLSDEYFAIRKLRSGGHELSDAEVAKCFSYFERASLRLFSDSSFDCAIDFSGYSYYWAWLMAFAPAKRKLIYQHSDMKAELDNPHRDHVGLESVFKAYHLYDRVVSVSAAIKSVNERALSGYYRSDSSISSANVIDFETIETKANVPVDFVCPEIANIPSETVVFVSVSRLSHEKNVTTLIEAFARLAREKIDSALVIVGDGNAYEELSRCAVAHGIDDRIIFTGNLTNPFPVMKRADCLMFPSYYEGQGLVLLEAMSLGTFCIGSDIPAVREVLSGTGCWVVPPRVDSLEDAMLRFVNERPVAINFDSDQYVKQAGNELWSALFGAR